jgi:hypothetical protein
VPPDDFHLTVNGVPVEPIRMKHFLMVPAMAGVQKIDIQFPIPDTRTVETMDEQSYIIDWHGDQIVAMSPPARYLPMFPPCRD